MRKDLSLTSGTNVFLSSAEKKIDRQLVQAFILQAAFPKRRTVKNAFLEGRGLVGRVAAKVRSQGPIVGVDLGEQCLDLWIFVELAGFILQKEVGPHAAARKRLDTFVIFGAIGMRIEVARACVA